VRVRRIIDRWVAADETDDISVEATG
jgi:hypothetical protein